MSTVQIIEISGTKVTIITDVKEARLSDKPLATYSAEAQKGFALFCQESAAAFDAAQETHDAKERTPGTVEYAERAARDAADREASAVALLVEHGAAQDEDEARAMVAAKAAAESLEKSTARSE